MDSGVWISRAQSLLTDRFILVLFPCEMTLCNLKHKLAVPVKE